jgi:hypothetical protein
VLDDVTGRVLQPSERREASSVYYFHEWNWAVGVEHLRSGLDSMRPDGWDQLVELRVPPEQREVPLPARSES